MPRWTGILPLGFFFAHLSTHLAQGTPQNMLWLCNLSNLVLAAGIFFRMPLLVRVSVLWLIPGIPLWVLDMARTGYSPATTFLSHLGGLVIGLFALSRVNADKNMWIHAWIYAFFAWIACRLFTSPDLNVNVAFQIYPPLDRVFHHYWEYWIFNAIFSAGGLWLLTQILNLRFVTPASSGPSSSSRARKMRALQTVIGIFLTFFDKLRDTIS